MPYPPHSSLATSHNIFQPPKSPPTVHASPSFAIPSDYFSHASRKRPRADSSHARDSSHELQTPWSATPSWAQVPTPGEGIFGSGYGQESSLVNERYRLAGGYDTPTFQESTAELDTSAANGIIFGRRLRGENVDYISDGAQRPLFGPLAGERNGIARIPSYSNGTPTNTWKDLAFGILGKAVSFGTTAFRGFFAGGGKGYAMHNADCALVGSDLLQERTPMRGSAPIPGSYVEDEFLGDFEQDNPTYTPTSTSRPPNKRRQTDRDTWVMVGTPDLEASMPSPKRKTSGSSIPTRNSLAMKPTASRASSRRSIAPVSRRMPSYVNAYGSPSQYPTPSTQATNRRASFASARSPQRRSSNAADTSYLTPEAERYAKRQAKQDRQNDKAMNSLNRKMGDMIRQAQAALGTKISVEGDAGGDEDFIDDDW